MNGKFLTTNNVGGILSVISYYGHIYSNHQLVEVSQYKAWDGMGSFYATNSYKYRTFNYTNVLDVRLYKIMIF